MARRRRGKGPRLLIFRDDHLTIAPAPADRIFIGRHRGAHIRIPHPDVNLKHAVIERIGVTEKFRVIDFGTTIPTLVDGEATGTSPIDYGTQIEIADVFIYFDRVRKSAPEEHQVAYENLIEMEKAAKNQRWKGAKQPAVEFEDEQDEVTEDLDAEEDDGEGEEAVEIKRRGRGRRRRRSGLKSSARRRRNAKGL